MAEESTKIPFEQALKLALQLTAINAEESVLSAVGQIVMQLHSAIQKKKQPLFDLETTLGIPISRCQLHIDIEKGPDENGMAVVRWNESDVKPKPKTETKTALEFDHPS